MPLATATVAPVSGDAPSRAAERPSELMRAPTLPGSSLHGESSSAAVPRRARLPASVRTGSVAQTAAASSFGNTAPAPSSAQQAHALAQQLNELESRRASLQADITAMREAGLANARGAGSAEDINELNKQQDRVDHARSELHGLLAHRDARLDQLERTERLLSSCERSLAALAVTADAPSLLSAPAAAASASSSIQPSSPSRQAADDLRAEEATASERIQQLSREKDVAKAEQERAKRLLAAARANVETQQAEAEKKLDSKVYVPYVDGGAFFSMNSFLQALELPPVDQLQQGVEDARYSRYVERLTQRGEDGVLRLKPEFLNPSASFAAFSALHCALMQNVVDHSLVRRLLPQDTGAINASLRKGGEDLEAVVHGTLIAGLDVVIHKMETLALAADRPELAMGGRRRRMKVRDAGSLRRNEVAEIGQRNKAVRELLLPLDHYAAITEGAVEQTCALLRGVVGAYQQALGRVDQAKAQLKDTMQELRPAFERPIQADRQLTEARAQIEQIRNELHRLESAEAKKKTKPPEAAIPQTVTVSASPSFDSEARGMKLRGDIEKHTESAERSNQEIALLDVGIREAEKELRHCEDQLEIKAAASARQAADARREHGTQRERLSELRDELMGLDGRIDQARNDLKRQLVPALISDRAWTRVIDRHVEPDNEAMRARTRETGYTGAYHSQADMARAVADIHAHVSQRPELQAVLASRTRAEFERAAAAVPGGVTDLVFDHERQVGRGFSNALDQTSRATQLTQSSYSLDFVKGRVVVSHLYPYVPYRQLQSAKAK